MKSNPYEFSNVDEPTKNTVALAIGVCPELALEGGINGNLTEREALKMASRCKAIRQRNSKTGKPISSLNGVLLLAVAGLVLLGFAGRKLIIVIRMANYAFENLLYWITCIVVQFSHERRLRTYNVIDRLPPRKELTLSF